MEKRRTQVRARMEAAREKVAHVLNDPFVVEELGDGVAINW